MPPKRQKSQRRRAVRAPTKRRVMPRSKPRKSPPGSRTNTFENFGSVAGGVVGNMVAPGIGGTVGSLVGRGLGGVVARIFGKGDYKVMENSLLRASSVPVFGSNSIRIRHKEFLGDFTGSTEFSLRSVSINPGLKESFPWLASIASNFEQYRVNGMVFQFVSTSSNALNSTNTALGKVIMATEYNALDRPFGSVQEMLITLFSNYGKPAESLTHAIECADSQRPTSLLYVRTGPAPAGSDLRLYDMANFQLASEGMQTPSNIGGLWVTYDVTLVKPIISPIDIATNFDHFRAVSCTLASGPEGSSGLTNLSPVRLGWTAFSQDLGPSVTFPSWNVWSTSFVAPTGITSGTFRITLTMYSDHAAFFLPPQDILHTGCTPVQVNQDSSVVITTCDDNYSLFQVITYYIQLSTPTSQFTIQNLFGEAPVNLEVLIETASQYITSTVPIPAPLTKSQSIFEFDGRFHDKKYLKGVEVPRSVPSIFQTRYPHKRNPLPMHDHKYEPFRKVPDLNRYQSPHSFSSLSTSSSSSTSTSITSTEPSTSIGVPQPSTSTDRLLALEKSFRALELRSRSRSRSPSRPYGPPVGALAEPPTE